MKVLFVQDKNLNRPIFICILNSGEKKYLQG